MSQKSAGPCQDSQKKLLVHRSIDHLNCREGRRRGENLDPSCRRKQRKAVHDEITFLIPEERLLEDYDTHLTENKSVNPMIIPKRALMSDTKYSTNIGMVVSNGARRMQRTSAATEIFASSYSLRPNSSSLTKVFYTLSA